MITPTVTVVGLGPAATDLLTEATRTAIAEHDVRFIRTRRHPSADAVGEAESFDPLYETAETFDEVYGEIVERLVDAAREHGKVLYAVPGSPAVAERTVELLRDDARVAVDVVPALSFADLAWARLGVDPLADGAKIIDGHRFAEQTAGTSGPFLVAQVDQPWVASEIKLSRDDADDVEVMVIQRLGLPDEHLEVVGWNELDRIQTDHLTSVWISALPASTGEAVARFEAMVDRLRRECPWDAEQTHASLRRYLVEETYETLEAIDAVIERTEREDGGEDAEVYDHLREELGDLAYQIFFHSVLAKEHGQFEVRDVIEGIHDKLFARHPHVFGDMGEVSIETVTANWEAIKQAEKGRASVLDGIPRDLPALAYAQKMNKKARSIEQLFVDGDSVDVVSSIEQAIRSAMKTNSVDEAARNWGAALFVLAAYLETLGVDAELALRDEIRLRRRDFPG